MTEDIFNAYMHKKQKLDDFCEKHKNSSEQRSEEWYRLTKLTFGGSEQSALLGENKYCSIQRLIAQKTGLESNPGNIFTRWGTYMEKPVSIVVSKILKVDMRELGALPGPVKFSRCSPDGLGLMQLDNEWVIILFEYKNPFTRVPTGTIPKEYIPQLKTGLCTIPIADEALFMDFITRVCSQENMNYSTDFNTEIHSKDTNHKKPLAMGNFVIYQTEDQRRKFLLRGEEDEDTIMRLVQDKRYKIECATTLAQTRPSSSKIKNKLIDFGNITFQQMSELLEAVEDDLFSILHTGPIIFDWNIYKRVKLTRQKFDTKPHKRDLDKLMIKLDKKTLNAFQRVIAMDATLIGVLGWKLFEWYIVRYKNEDHDFLQKQEPKMIEMMKIIQSIKESNTPWATYHEYFPTWYKRNSDDNPNGEDLQPPANLNPDEFICEL